MEEIKNEEFNEEDLEKYREYRIEGLNENLVNHINEKLNYDLLRTFKCTLFQNAKYYVKSKMLQNTINTERDDLEFMLQSNGLTVLKNDAVLYENQLIFDCTGFAMFNEACNNMSTTDYMHYLLDGFLNSSKDDNDDSKFETPLMDMDYNDFIETK